MKSDGLKAKIEREGRMNGIDYKGNREGGRVLRILGRVVSGWRAVKSGELRQI